MMKTGRLILTSTPLRTWEMGNMPLLRTCTNVGLPWPPTLTAELTCWMSMQRAASSTTPTVAPESITISKVSGTTRCVANAWRTSNGSYS